MDLRVKEKPVEKPVDNSVNK